MIPIIIRFWVFYTMSFSGPFLFQLTWTLALTKQSPWPISWWRSDAPRSNWKLWRVTPTASSAWTSSQTIAKKWLKTHFKLCKISFGHTASWQPYHTPHPHLACTGSGSWWLKQNWRHTSDATRCNSVTVVAGNRIKMCSHRINAALICHIQTYLLLLADWSCWLRSRQLKRGRNVNEWYDFTDVYIMNHMPEKPWKNAHIDVEFCLQTNWQPTDN